MSHAQRLLELFAGLPRACGQFKIEGKKKGEKITGRAFTVLEPPDLEKWEAHLSGDTGIGIVPIRDDSTCCWGCIDIDQYPLDHLALEAKCKELDLPLVPARTKSGGAHLYVFTGDVPAQLMRTRLMQYAAALGYPGVEIFPKQVQLANEKDIGNWLNMPYFDVANTTRYAIIGGKPATLEQFLSRAEKLRKKLTAQVFEDLTFKDVGEFNDGPPCLQALSKTGLPEGTRNNGLFAYGVYARMKFEDDWRDKLEDYNRRLLSEPLAAREVTAIERSLMRKTYFYPCTKAPCVGACNKELCRDREFGIGDSDPDDPGINIGALVKITTDPPTWIIDVNGIRMEMDTEVMLSQESFRRLCVERLNVMPNRVKPFVWEKLLRDKLLNVEEIEAPSDAGVEGRFFTLVEQFCTSQALARAQDELLAGKPWVEGERVYFRSFDLTRYLDQQHFREFTTKQLWAVLRRHGAKHHTFQLKGKCVQCWSLKAYAQQDSDFDVPPERDD